MGADTTGRTPARQRLATPAVPGRFLTTMACLCISLLALSAQARVTAEQAARLGTDLTPLGAERSGNPAGTIPAWEGGITTPPEDFNASVQHPDPFPDDPVLFVITAANMAEHAEHLTPGQRALLTAYPSWRIPVYRTRRSAAFPDYVYEAAKANATRAEVILTGKGGVEGADITSPFPIPGSGVEVVWNHTLRWRGVRVSGLIGTAAVTRGGRYQVLLRLLDYGIPYAAVPGSEFKAKYPGVMAAIKNRVVAPVLQAGSGSLVIEPLNQTDNPRRAWAYVRASRQVVRLPYFGYDFPGSETEGLRTVDDYWQFNGPPDRYDWQLVGKREIYVPYNAYRLHASELAPGDIVGERHINPDLTRYELHRVWVVEGTLKEGASHRYARRSLFVDEDSWNILLSDRYDAQGALWRTSEAHVVNYYDVPVLLPTLEVFYDLKAQRYLVEGLDNERRPLRFEEDGDPREFSPNSLRYFLR